MTKLFRKVFPYLLRLGCDVERVSKFAECVYISKYLKRLASPFSSSLPLFPGGRAAVSAAGVPDDPLVHEEHAVREPRHHGSPGRHPGKTSIVLVLASLDQLTPTLKDQFVLGVGLYLWPSFYCTCTTCCSPGWHCAPY